MRDFLKRVIDDDCQMIRRADVFPGKNHVTKQPKINLVTS